MPDEFTKCPCRQKWHYIKRAVILLGVLILEWLLKPLLFQNTAFLDASFKVATLEANEAKEKDNFFNNFQSKGND